ncbi:hypothetical protein [Streptomyces sp. 1331.2]|nr:hypothetical protein [Streptomyces sp. 1331.2]SOB86346.1 hypothetical protein SAMN06272789_6658 [Streptomyces sp. 1331.2]
MSRQQRSARPFLELRVGGLRLTLQSRPRRLLLLLGPALSTLAGVLALRR